MKTSAPRKRLGASSGNDADAPPVRPKRSKIARKRRRLIASVLPDGATLLATLTIPWNPSEDNPPQLGLQIEENGDEPSVNINDVPVPINSVLAEALFSQKLVLLKEIMTDSSLKLHVAAKHLPLTQARFLVENLFLKDYSDYDDAKPVVDASGWKQFFRELDEIQRSRDAPSQNFQHADLEPILRTYQSAAVGWMLEREKNPGFLNLTWLNQVTEELLTPSGSSLLYAKYAEVIYLPIKATPICSGGILADEMGLGKTVITLALILNHHPVELGEWNLVESPDKIEPRGNMGGSGSPSKKSAREFNQEGCLDVDEELQQVKCKLSKGMLRSKLNAWYESKLAEMSVQRTSPEKQKRIFKCVCGDDVYKIKEAAKCQCCGLMQHRHCCGYVSDQSYVCPNCWRQQSPFPTGATLIVVPPAIFGQWVSEIERHTPSLKLIQYSGIKDKFIQPMHLADFDIVLTTYGVLRSESLYAEEPSQRSMRNEGRFLRSSCPLEKVAWWRIVCDEAQLVESDFSQIRLMTQRLTATHRWCVTGTPIQKSVADLYYLTSFMGLGVFDIKETWSDLLLKPYVAGCKDPLLSVIQQVFWRSTKDEVNEELCVPDQSFESHFLKFTAIEEAFYMQEHARSASNFVSGLRKSTLDVTRTIESVDKGILKKLLQPLLNIRQACTHPQVVSGITITSASGAANLGELLQYLQKKTKQEVEESLRRHVAALNGLAGLSCLKGEWSEAIGFYRDVLRLAADCEDGGTHVDTLQRIHALWNAAEVLESHPNCAPPTLRDDNLRSDAAALEKKYLTKAEEAMASFRVQVDSASKEVEAALEDFESAPGAWWLPVILDCTSIEEELVDKLRETLHSNDYKYKASSKKFLTKISSLTGIQYAVKQWWIAVEKHHQTVKNTINTLFDISPNILVEDALGCHLRVEAEKKAKNKCAMCKMEGKMQDLECELFDTSKKEGRLGKEALEEKVLDGSKTKGTWIASYSERTLQTAYNFARGKIHMEPWCINDAKAHFRLLEAMKKEFKHTRAAWLALNHRVQSEDELTMAKIRLRVAEPWETQRRPNILALSAPNKNETIHLVPLHEIPSMINELITDRVTTLSDFRKKQGKLLYLQNLGKDRNAKPDPCPVCKLALVEKWCVLQCGHCYCIDCLQRLHGPTTKRIKCPVCREFTESADIGFVDTSGSGAANEDISVIGDYSTKVDNIVRQVIKLIEKEPDVKILIFSTWIEVFKILQHALSINKLPFLSLPSAKHQLILKKFREEKNGAIVLLLPLAWGSKGLNLIEATHVFLVEPILNPAEELQAIGRVHRIGQTRPTTVHRFIVNNTVEQKIFAAVSEAKDTWSNKTVTLADLQRLFAIPQR